MNDLPIDEFERVVGLLDEEERLAEIGAPAPDEENGAYGPRRLAELEAFCEANPGYHIVTELDDDRFENTVRIVNRLNYYLADGDTGAYESSLD